MSKKKVQVHVPSVPSDPLKHATSEICCHNVIVHLLKKVNTSLTIDCLQENETDITMLGFFINVDPGNFL